MDDVKHTYRTGDRYIVDMSDIFRWEMHYGIDGQYIGQVQTNVLDDGPDFFFSADMVDGVPCVNGEPVRPLSEEERAIADSSFLAPKNTHDHDNSAGGQS